MIEFDCARGKIVRGSIEERITEWTVWFRTPFGLCETLDEAVERVKRLDMDPNMTIIPVPVAKTGNTHETYER